MTPKTKKTSEVVVPEVKPAEERGWFMGHIIEIILFLAALVILGLFTFFMYQKMNEERGFVNYLPADKTVGFISVSLQNNQTDLNRLNALVAKSGSGSLIWQLTGVSDADFEKNVSPLLGATAGVALLQDEQKNLSPVVFIGVKEKEKMLDFIGNKWNDGNVPAPFLKTNPSLLSFTDLQKGYLFTMDKYIVWARDLAPLQAIEETEKDSKKSLYRTETFTNWQKNMPPAAFLTLYADYRKGIQIIRGMYAERKEYRDFFTLLTPFEKDVFNLGISLSWQEKNKTAGWYSKMVVTGNPALFGPFSKLSGAPTEAEKKIGTSTLVYAGGFDFLRGLQKTLLYFSDTAPDSEIVLEAMFNELLHKYLAGNVSYIQLLGLSSGEYSLFFEILENRLVPGVIAVLPVSNEADAAKLLEDMFLDFRTNSELLYTPIVQDLVLPDGTVGKELVLHPKEIKEESKPVQGATAHFLSITNDTFSPGYILLDGKAYLFSHQETLEPFLDRQSADRPFSGATAMIHFQGQYKGALQVPPYFSWDWVSNPSWRTLLSPLKKMVFAVEFVENGMLSEQFFAH